MEESALRSYPVIHPFTYMPEEDLTSNYNFNHAYMKLTRGQGAWVYDEDGKQYLYAATAVPSVGLGRSEIIESITQQMRKLSFSSTCAQYHGLESELANRLIKLCDNHYSKVFFSNDGSGAIETAMRIARQYFLQRGEHKRNKFISLEGSYHGTTFGSGSVTHMGIRENFGPGLEGCIHVPAPNLYRPPLEGDPESVINYCLDQLEKALYEEGIDEVAAILLEPIQGVNGVVPIPQQYVIRLREISHKYGILLIMDEVGTGLGRTGHWSMAQYYNVIPDILALSKGLTGGYFPMGATLISPGLDHSLFGKGGIFLHGSTQSGHPVGCVAARAVLDVIENEKLIENASTLGSYILEELGRRIGDYAYVGDIRGTGMMLGIEFVADRSTKEPANFSLGQQLTRLLRQSGVIGNYFNNVLALYPPLSLTLDEANHLIQAVTTAVQSLHEQS